jgi:hypothetical protein
LEGQSKVTESTKKGHTRSQSKGSLKSNLSRRSSAEFSAKQLSLLGVSGKSSESWEVQVSKELLRLSLAQDVVNGGGKKRVVNLGSIADGPHSILGHVSARGNNVGSFAVFPSVLCLLLTFIFLSYFFCCRLPFLAAVW